MSNASDVLENSVVDHIFRTGTWAKPTALWIALCLTDPTDANGGTEVTGPGYTRINLPPLDTNWLGTHGTTTGASSGTGGQTSNAVDIQFPAPTGDWGVPTHYKLMSLAAGGTMLAWGEMDTPQEILNGSPAPLFPAGSMIFTVA